MLARLLPSKPSSQIELVPGTPDRRALLGMTDLIDLEPAPVVGVHLDEPLLTAQDVSVLLRVPRSSVYEYARRRHEPLPSVPVGRHRRFYRSDVEAWLTTQRAARR